MEEQSQSSPLCQSCGHQMIAPGIKGTNADSSKNEDYCRFCFREGKFLEPTLTEEQMIEKNASIVSQKSQISLDQAKSMARHFIPKLRRWKEAKKLKSPTFEANDFPLE